jgi:hypothetical protein
MANSMQTHEKGFSVTPSDSFSDFLAFCRVPRLLYDGYPGYGAHFDLERWTLHSARFNAHFKLIEASQGWVARRGGVPIGRIFVQLYREEFKPVKASRGQFGCLDAVNEPLLIDALLDQAESWLRDRGETIMHGPYSPSINSESGLLVDGFSEPPMVLMPWNPPYIKDALERRGYERAQDLLSYRYDVTSRDRQDSGSGGVLSRPEWKGRLRVRSADFNDLVREVQTVVDIFNDAWSENWGFVPFTVDEFMSNAKALKWILPADASFIVELDGNPQAFGIVLPNFPEVTSDLGGRLMPFNFLKAGWRLRTGKYTSGLLALFGVRRALHRSATGGAVLLAFIDELRRRSRRLNLDFLEIGWIIEDNHAIRRPIELQGSRVYKTRRIYKKSLIAN